MVGNYGKSAKAAKKQAILVCLLASLAGILFGMDTGIISGALPFVAHQFSATTLQQEMIVSAVLAGAVIGTIISAMIAKAIGRRKTILVSAIIFIVASILSSLVHSIDALVIARVFLGVAVGMAAYSAPLYLAEVAAVANRGALISLYQAMVNLGIVIALITDLVFTYTASWRLMLFSLAVPAVLLFIGAWCMPSSPRWLVLTGKNALARKVLRSLRQGSNQEIDQEISDIERVEKLDHEGWRLFKHNINFRKVVFLGVALQAAQQITGINVMFYYAPKIFSLLGIVSATGKMWGGVSLGVTDFVFTLVAILFIDRVGRKPLLYGGASGMGLAFLILAYLLSTAMNTVALKMAAIAMLIIFMIAFAMSAGPVIWILCSEINPLKGRSLGTMTSTSTNWIVNLLIGATFLSLLDSLGEVKVFVLYGLINLALLLLYYFYTPETRQVSLEHLEGNLMSGKPLREIGH